MKENTKKEIWSWIKTVGITIVIAFLCKQFLFLPMTVSGESMLPTFQNKDKVIVSKVSQIKRFDIIVFKAPDIPGKLYVKRIIGLPGDEIEMKNDLLYINGLATDEPYIEGNKEKNPFRLFTEDFTLEKKTGKVAVPEDVYFVMGDNRLRSKDSRALGFIPFDAVIGEVKFRFYPFQEIGIPK